MTDGYDEILAKHVENLEKRVRILEEHHDKVWDTSWSRRYSSERSSWNC